MFRVTIQGTFDGLSEAARATLAADAEAFHIGYTEKGTFTCDRSFSAFTFRCQVPAERDDDGDDEATLRALVALDAHGYRYHVLRVGVTDLREMKIRRKVAKD